MFSWKNGVEIAKIRGGEHDGKTLRINGVTKGNARLDYLRKLKGIADRENKEDYKKELVLKEGELVPMIRPEEHQNIYAAAPSGAGKSTVVSMQAKLWKKQNPEGKIVIFSRLKSDKVLDKLKPVRITLDDELLEDPIEMSELENCFVIFDDCETITNKKLGDYVRRLRDDLGQTGRHHGIICASTSHHVTDYAKTRDLLLEATDVYTFPKSSSSEISYFCEKYMKLSKSKINKVLSLPTERWLLFKRNSPQCVMYDGGALIL
jgi:hypothetical protein